MGLALPFISNVVIPHNYLRLGWEENNMRRLVTLALALSLVGSSVLLAQKPKKQKGKSQETQVTVVFVGTQREAARSALCRAQRSRQLPPRPGQEEQWVPASGTGEEALRRWPTAAARDSGRGTARGICRVRIGPAPAGYRYGILDGDLVKLAVGTLLVVDAIDGLVR